MNAYKQADEQSAVIYFIDEASIRSDYHSGTTWGRKGRTPLVVKTGARFGINMIAAVSSCGSMRYMTIPGRFNADAFIKFLKQIVNSHDRPVLIVTDGHSAHKAKKVMKYLRGESRLLDIQLLSRRASLSATRASGYLMTILRGQKSAQACGSNVIRAPLSEIITKKAHSLVYFTAKGRAFQID